MSPSTHLISLDRYHIETLGALARAGTGLDLADAVATEIDAGARFAGELARGDAHVYGVNSGFGALAEHRVSVDDVEALQWNHIVSHAAGVGPPVSERLARLTLLVKLLTFRTGRTAISLDTVKRLIAMWNAGVIPVIPMKGTVGASGDLAPLAHMALPLIGLGEVWMDGRRCPASEAAARHGWTPIHFGAKEGLALTNGTQYITALAVDALLRIDALLDMADLVAALSAQAFSTSLTYFHPLYHSTTHHVDRRLVARHLAWATANGNHHTLSTAQRSKQDPYSFRCIPQVHGAVRQVHRFCRQTIEDELNGVSDNPLFFAEESEVLFGGNLHGQSVAFALDFLAMAASELSSISERRVYQLLSGRRGLPDFLALKPGLHSGLMLAQYTAAALVNENKTLCHPASVDTIPTSQLQEDHVSMGGTAGYKLMTVIDNCEYVLGIELFTAAQAAEMTPALQLSPIGGELHGAFRRIVPFVDADRVISGDIERARRFIGDEAPGWSARLRAATRNS
jgi:histidine ammonia-lyase